MALLFLLLRRLERPVKEGLTNVVPPSRLRLRRCFRMRMLLLRHSMDHRSRNCSTLFHSMECHHHCNNTLNSNSNNKKINNKYSNNKKLNNTYSNQPNNKYSNQRNNKCNSKCNNLEKSKQPSPRRQIPPITLHPPLQQLLLLPTTLENPKPNHTNKALAAQPGPKPDSPTPSPTPQNSILPPLQKTTTASHNNNTAHHPSLPS